ncbi:MAG: glutamate synthase-related protein [Verrucomicrobiales bacterium]
MSLLWWIPLGLLALLIVLGLYDVLQRGETIPRNFPVVGRLRALLQRLGPPLRQYIVSRNDEERPFSRDERRWIYTSAGKENSYFGFGTDNDLELEPNYVLIKHRAFPLDSPHPGKPGYDRDYRIPCAKVLGASRGRAKAFRPASVVNVSAMSFGSLGGRAVEALNRGCAIAGCLHNTGEGGISLHHLHGGELILQLGTAYFGSRGADGNFSMDQLKATVAQNPQVRAIEIKLSQGAKPALGGLLPAAKVTREIAEARGIPEGVDCASPARHSAFEDADSMLDFVEAIAGETGLPVGIKSAVGELEFWEELADLMADGGRGVDFMTIDGGEGGTGAGPLVFTDHVALPFKIGFSRVYGIFAERGLSDRVVWVGSAKLGLPANAFLAFAMGCDMVSVAREAMLSIGCIQAQECHTGHCPAGVATHHKWLVRGLDPTLKSARLANYVLALRKDLLQLSRACGVPHPGLVTPGDVEIIDGRLHSAPVDQVFCAGTSGKVIGDGRSEELGKLMDELQR